MLRGDVSDRPLDAELQRILEALTAPVILSSGVINITVSIGAAVYPIDARAPEQLIRAADIAMYAAKREGGSAVRLHAAEMTEFSSRRALIERELHSAIDADGLEVHYQPIVALTDWSLHCVEALVRWNHPVHGSFAPADWIPIAEETGLISAVGARVRGLALADLQSWDRAGYAPVRVAVNVSPLEFRSGTLASSVLRDLERTGLDRSRLLVELTESALGDAAGEIAGSLNELRSAGVETAIDDFGTGHSALSHISSFPADVLKIDRSLVQPLPDHPESRAIVEGVVILAHRLGLTTVAEGVETRRQVEYLTSIGCDMGQGFFFARAMSADQLAAWLSRTAELAA
jgi:EAL domain-containing protein (putative c-di-GMP-specific phosphodiesterase class I)